MKIAFFSEIGRSDKFPRNFENMRTDVAWAVALDATIHYIDSWYRMLDEKYDLGIIIMPKKHPKKAWNCFETNQEICKKWAMMQEGPSTFYQDYNIETQFEYLNFLSNLDIIFCHNEIDKKYYSGLIPGKKVEILPSLMIEDAIDKKSLNLPEVRSGVVIGGNFVSWYSGLDSFLVAQELNETVYAPSMGRKQEQENDIEGIRYLPYMNWQRWITELSKRKYAIHLMRTYAAGTFSLNCAFLGIPCIGYESLDTQRICFPELSIKEGDLVTARKAIQHLKNNQQYYDYVSEYAKKAWYDNYREEKFVETFKAYFNELYL